MKKYIVQLLILAAVVCVAGCSKSGPSTSVPDGELSGEITFWHSFTQGPRLESLQKSADAFMQEHPKVKINIETFSWNDFYIKWTTGLASGNVPDMSTALPSQVVEMISVDALVPLNDLIDSIGRGRFSEAALSEGTVSGSEYSVPLYSHAQVMWIRKDLLDENGFDVPKTWDELYLTAKALTKDGVYGLSFPCGSTDFQATNFLNFYVRSFGGSLLTDELRVDLTNDLVIEGINYWLKVYRDCSPKDSVNYDVLDQATLYYQGKTAFDFNSGFQISGVQANSPDLLPYIDCYPIPLPSKDAPRYGITTANQPLVVWKKSKYPEVCKAFIKTLYEESSYIDFLHATPVGMLPAVKGIADTPAYRDNPIIQQFGHAEQVIGDAVEIGTEIGFEHGPSVQAGIVKNNHVIEKMFQDIITNGADVMTAAKAAEDELNALIDTLSL